MGWSTFGNLILRKGLVILICFLHSGVSCGGERVLGHHLCDGTSLFRRIMHHSRFCFSLSCMNFQILYTYKYQQKCHVSAPCVDSQDTPPIPANTNTRIASRICTVLYRPVPMSLETCLEMKIGGNYR